MVNLDEVQHALNEGKFFLEYMPTMSLADNRCVGAEVLIRWQNNGKVIYPSDFIPHIENTPLSGLVTYWVIDKVAKEMRDWLCEQEAIRISINVPPEIVGRGGISYAAHMSRLTDVADKMMLEVTERGLLDSLGIAAINMAVKGDVMVALDDLALNDASLLVLSRVAASVVKLDKSFADEMLEPEWTYQKISGISALIRSGNLRVIAEGIETAKQVEILMDAGIQMAQGWYFSRPLPAADFKEYFSMRQ